VNQDVSSSKGDSPARRRAAHGVKQIRKVMITRLGKRDETSKKETLKKTGGKGGKFLAGRGTGNRVIRFDLGRKRARLPSED